MTGMLDNVQIDIACPKCGRKFKERLGRLQNNPLLHCSGCGSEIQINASGKGGLSEGMKSVDKSFSQLQSALKKLSK